MWSKCNFYLFIIYEMAYFTAFLSLALCRACVWCASVIVRRALQVRGVTADKYAIAKSFPKSKLWNPLKLQLRLFVPNDHCDRRTYMSVFSRWWLNSPCVCVRARSLKHLLAFIFMCKTIQQSESMLRQYFRIFMINLSNITKFTSN